MSDDFDLDAEDSDDQSEVAAAAAAPHHNRQHDSPTPLAAAAAASEAYSLSPLAPRAAADGQEDTQHDAEEDSAEPFPSAGLSPVVDRSAAAASAEDEDDAAAAAFAAPAPASAGAGKRSARKKNKGKKGRAAKAGSSSPAAAAAAAVAPATPVPAAAPSEPPHTLMSLAASENESSSPLRPRTAAGDSVASTPASAAATPLPAASSAPAATAAAPSEPSSLTNTPMSVHSFSVHSGSLAATPVQPRSSANTVPASAMAAASTHAANDDASAAPASAEATVAATQRAPAPAPRARSTSARRSDSTGSNGSASARPHTGLSSSLASAKPKPQPDLPPRIALAVTVPKEFRCAQKQTKSSSAAVSAAPAAAAADDKDATQQFSLAASSSSAKITPAQQEATISRLYRSAAEKEEWLAAERRRKEAEEVAALKAEMKQFKREPRTATAASTAAAAAEDDASAAAKATAAPTAADSAATAEPADKSNVSHAAKLYYRAIVEAELRERQMREATLQAQAAQCSFKPELNPHSRVLASQSKRSTDHTSPTRQSRSLSSGGGKASAPESKTNDDVAQTALTPTTIIAAFSASSNADFSFHPTINAHSKAMLSAAAAAASSGSAESAEQIRQRKKAERIARHLAAEPQELTFKPVINPPRAATASWTRQPAAAPVKQPDAESKQADDADAATAAPSATADPARSTRAFSPISPSARRGPSSAGSSPSAARVAPLSPHSRKQVKELYQILYKEDGTAATVSSKRSQQARPQTASVATAPASATKSSALGESARPKSAAAPASAAAAASAAAQPDATSSAATSTEADAADPAATDASANVTPPPAAGSEEVAAAAAASSTEAAKDADSDAALYAAAEASIPELALDQTRARTRDRNPATSARGSSSTRRDGSQSARSSSIGAGATAPSPVFVAAHIPARMQVWSTQAAERKDLIRRSVEERALAECTFAPRTNAPTRRSSGGSGGPAAAATLARAQRIAREWTNAATFAVPPGSSPGSSNSPSPAVADPNLPADAARPGSASSAVHQRVLPSRSLMVSSTLVPEVHALGFHFVRQERARVLRREEEFVRTGQHRGAALGTARSTSVTRSAAPTVAPTLQVSPRAHHRIVAPLAQLPARSYVELHVPSAADDAAAASAELPQPQPQPQPASQPRPAQAKPQPQPQSKPRSHAAPTAAALAPAVALPFRPTRLHQAAVAKVPSHRLTSPARVASVSPHGPARRALASSSSSSRRKSQSPRALLQSVGGTIDAQGNLSFAHSPAGSPRSRAQRSHKRLSGGSSAGAEALLSPNSTLLQLSSLDLGHAVGASPPFASRSLPLGSFAANASLDLEADTAEEDKELWQAQVLAERLRLEHARLRALQRAQHQGGNQKQNQSTPAMQHQQQQQQWSPNRGVGGLPPRKAAPQNPLSPPRSNAAPMAQQQQFAASAYESVAAAAPSAPVRRSALQSALAAVTENLPNLDALLHRSMLREMEHRGELVGGGAPSIVSPHHQHATGGGHHSPLVLVPVAALSMQTSRSHSPASMQRAMEMHSPSSSSSHSNRNSPPRTRQQQHSPVQFTQQQQTSAASSVSLAKDLPPSPVAAYFSPPPQPMQLEQRIPPAADPTTAAAEAEPSLSRSHGRTEKADAEPSVSRRSASASLRAGDLDGFDAGSVDPDLSFDDDADESITSEVEEELELDEYGDD